VKAALIISDRDNVATALEPLEPGRRIELGRKPTSSVASVESVVVIEAIPPGHKVALQPIAAGAAVIKYGSPIGLATADIAAGAHVHTHNLASSRGRGDLGPAGARDPQTRLAEPPDGANGAGRQSAPAGRRA
jgi:altronate hydrolase